MLRVSRARVVAITVAVAAALVVVAGLSWRALQPRSGPAAVSTPGAGVIRDPNSTLYVAPSGILFDVDSATLHPDAIPVLRGIVADMAGSHLDGTIRVEGHTDDVGTDPYNLALSRSRAETVSTWLVEEAGIQRSRVQAIALGESSPAQPNDSDAHRQANRRVVIAVER